MRSVEEEVQQNYIYVDSIGNGSFGHIISVQSRDTQEQFACKIEKNHGKAVVLVEKQFNILKELSASEQFPAVRHFKRLQENSYIVMERLDRNLDQLVKLHGTFPLETISLVAEQVFSSFATLHGIGFLHRDIKPENIMTSRGSHAIKLIDFGLAERVGSRRTKALIGNVRYSSRQAHLGFSSKKGDLQSFISVLFYLMVGSLPWENASKEQVEAEINRVLEPDSVIQKTAILQMKCNFLLVAIYPKSSDQIELAFYEQFHSLASLVYNMGDNDDPDYEEILHRCMRLMAIIGTERGKCYCWCPIDCPNRNVNDLWAVFGDPIVDI